MIHVNVCHPHTWPEILLISVVLELQIKEINYFYKSYFQRVTFKCTQKKVSVKKALPFIKSDFEKKRKLTLGVGNRPAWGEGEKSDEPWDRRRRNT